ncbi:DUF6230 family protein [Actinoplanes sp. NPDC049265]|uniref:DUF6230 family protein n=1 Tax=Actinoplanes sp. NPDC049265 TaxID=3363902 RepID=UPI00371B4AB5
MTAAVSGRTNWRRFALAAGVPVVAAGGLLVMMSQGALAASFAVSGQDFKISADRLDGTGFSQYGGVVKDASGKQIPVSMSGIANAELTNLCQSVHVKDSPMSLTITAGTEKGQPAEATNLLIGMKDLSGDATFTNINIGQDAGTLTKGGADAKGETGSFGQQSDKILIDGLKQTAVSTTAGTFKLTGLNLKLNFGSAPKECF